MREQQQITKACNRHPLPKMICGRGNPPVSNTIQRRPEGEKGQLPDSTHPPAAGSEHRHIVGLHLKVHLLSTPRRPRSYQSVFISDKEHPAQCRWSFIGNMARNNRGQS